MSPRLSGGLIPDGEVIHFPLDVFGFGLLDTECMPYANWSGDFPLARSPVTSCVSGMLKPSQFRIWDRVSCFKRSTQNRGAIQWRKWGPKLTPVTPLFAGVNKESF